VLVSRLVFRRGIDILIELLPELCENNPALVIELVGDGPKMRPLREMIRLKGLEGRTVVHGGLPNQQALAVVRQCHIFLNTALTESFGIAIVEAASLGLHVITSNVGGVAEVLPPEHMHIAELSKDGFLRKIQQVVGLIEEERKQGKERPAALNLYPKEEVFERVTEVYEEVMRVPRESKVPRLFCSLLLKGNLINCLVLFLLLCYSVWDLLEGAARKVGLRAPRSSPDS
jgi:phosphatidylinositol N-acetylglucosaminyltransferase subunit A